MTPHLDARQLELLVQGKLDEREAAQVRSHLESCEACRAEYEECLAGDQMAEEMKHAVDDRSTLDLGGTISLPYGDGSPLTGLPTIRGYRVIREIHRGGQGVVYEANQEAPERRVAIKVLLHGPFAGDRAKARFEREVELAGNLKHQNIVTIQHSGVAGGNYWFAMDYVEGQRLDIYLAGRTLSIADKLRLFSKICDAVMYAHQRQVIHRDLKPSNILVDDQGEPRILDFGLARQVEPTESLDISLDGQVMGTLPYMSPEQARGDQSAIDTRTDVYSLGVILYEMLTGKYPIEIAGTMDEILERVRHAERTPPSRIIDPDRSRPKSVIGRLRSLSLSKARRGVIDTDVETIVMRALAMEPDRRYASPGHLRADVKRYLAGEAIEARRDSRWYVAWKTLVRYRVAAAIAAGFVLVVTAGLFTSTAFWRQAAEQRDAAQQATLTAQEKTEDALRAQEKERTQRELAEKKTQEAEWNAYLANITAANAALRLKEIATVRARLGFCPERLRGWEWRYLHAAADESLLTLRGHPGWVRCAAFSPDGKRILTVSNDKMARIWDADTGHELHKLRGHDDHVSFAAWSMDGTRIVTTSFDKTAKIWDAATFEELATLHGHASPICSAAFSPDGKRIITAAVGESKPRIWDLATQEEVATQVNDLNQLRFVAWSPDGKRVTTASHSEATRVLDSASWRTLAILRDSRGFADWGSDGKWIVTGSTDGATARICDATTYKTIATFHHAPDCTSAALSPDGKQLVTASWDGTMRLWDVATRKQLGLLLGHTGMVESISFAPDNKRCVTASRDETAKVWNLEAVEDTGVLFAGWATVDSLAFSPDGGRIVLPTGGDTAEVWETDTWQKLAALRGHSGRTVRCATFSPDGTRIVTGSDDTTARIWDASTAKLTAILRGHDGIVNSAAFSPNGKWIVTASEDSTVRIWNAATAEQEHCLRGHHGHVDSVVFSPDGRFIVSASGADHVKLWDVAKCEVVASQYGFGVNCIAFGGDGRYVATASERMLRVWDPATGRDISPLSTRTGEVTYAVFSPDGKRLLTGLGSGGIVLWDLATGQASITFRGRTEVIESAAFTDDGKRVLSGSADGIKLWDAVTGNELITLREDTRKRISYTAFQHDGNRIVAAIGGTIRVWDTVPYAQRYRERQAALEAREAARPIVEALRAKLTDWGKVAIAVRDDFALDKSVQRQALNLVLQSSSAELNAQAASQPASQPASGPAAAANRISSTKPARISRTPPSLIAQTRRPAASQPAGRDVASLVSLLTHGDEYGRSTAAVRLAEKGKEAQSACPTLVTNIVGDAEPMVRRACVNSLAKIDPTSEQTITAIARAMEDKDASVRIEAACRLREMAKAQGSGLGGAIQTVRTRLGGASPLARAAVPALTKALGDADKAVCRAAASALGTFGPEAVSAVPALAALTSTTEEALRLEAVRSLRAIGRRPEVAVPVLVKGLEDPRLPVRRLCCQALSEFGSDRAAKAAVPRLKELLKDPDAWVRAYSLLALGRIGVEDVDSIVASIDAVEWLRVFLTGQVESLSSACKLTEDQKRRFQQCVDTRLKAFADDHADVMRELGRLAARHALTWTLPSGDGLKRWLELGEPLLVAGRNEFELLAGDLRKTVAGEPCADCVEKYIKSFESWFKMADGETQAAKRGEAGWPFPPSPSDTASQPSPRVQSPRPATATQTAGDRPQGLR